MAASRKRNRNSFVKQAAILAGAGMLVRVLGFAYRLPLTDLIGDIGNSIYSIGFNIYNFFLIMSSSGLPAAISKMVSERNAKGRPDEAHRVFKTALALASVMGLICMLVIYFGAEFIVNIIDSPRSYYALLALSPTVLIVAIMAVFRGYFQGMQNAAPTALSQLVEQIFNAFFSVFLAYLFIKGADIDDDSIALGAAGGTAGTGIGALAGLIFIVGFYFLMRPLIMDRINFYGKRRGLRYQSVDLIIADIIKIAVPIILGTAIFSISNLIDTAMVKDRLEVSGIIDPDEIERLYGQLTGKYVTITTLPVAISTALATAAIPSIAASVVLKEKKAVNNKINTAVRLAMIITIPSAVGIGILADQIIRLLMPNHPEGGNILAAGSVSIIFLALYLILAGMLQATGKLKIPVLAAASGALIKVPMNFFLVANPGVRIIGAVISTTVCYAVASAICWYFLVKETKALPDFESILIKPMIASIGMGLGCYTIYYVIYFIRPANTIATLSAIVAGVILYVIFLLLIGGIRKSDVRLLPMGDRIAYYLERRGLID